jgi:hypothetical protein
VLLVLARFRQRGLNAVTSRDFGENILQKLLIPIASDPPDPDVAGLHALLIVRQHQGLEVGQPSDFDEYALQRLSPELQESTRTPADGFRRFKVAEFSKEQLEHHFDEFTEFIDDPAMDGLRVVIRTLVQSASWRPNQLNVVQDSVVALSKLQPRRP